MSNEERKHAVSSGKKAGWQRPSLKYVGHVGEIFQFPGGGKLSLVADDSGDEQRKPKGQE
jgi:hypothetical protein